MCLVWLPVRHLQCSQHAYMIKSNCYCRYVYRMSRFHDVEARYMSYVNIIYKTKSEDIINCCYSFIYYVDYEYGREMT